MLSYRHAFHAGNHADVFKHLVLIALIERLTTKPAALRYIETHAGAGSYRLDSKEALLNLEFESGIGRLWSMPDLPEPLARLVALVREHSGGQDRLCRYPGSPWLARACLRPEDSLFLHELHPAESKALRASCRGDRRVSVRQSDGLAGSIGLVPPPERRAFVFMDPSYEVNAEHRQVVDAFAKMYRRFATGVYVIWYPILAGRAPAALLRPITAMGIATLLRIELNVAAARGDYGLTGSGMLIVNPPWKLAECLQESLHFLTRNLGWVISGSDQATLLN